MFKFLCVMIRRPTRSTRTYTLSPDTTLFRYSGPDEPGDGFRGFLDLGLRLGAAHSGSPDDAVAQVLLEQTEGDRAQRLGHRGDLGEDGDAILLLLRSEEHTSELQSLMRISYAVFCLKKTTNSNSHINIT